MADDPHAPPLIENQTMPPRWSVTASMNEAGGVSVAMACPSPDIAWMLLARALMYVEREGLAQRVVQVSHEAAPRVIPPTPFGTRPPI